MTLTTSPTPSTPNTYYRRTTCVLCGSGKLELAVPLGRSAIGNDYVLSPDQPQELYSLNLFLCTDCGNVQVEDVVDPDLLFRSYTYSTAHSLGLVDHFRKYAVELLRRLPTSPGNLIVDIGSNDGSLLRAFQEQGLRVLGVDPALGLAQQATALGLPTVADFFTAELGRRREPNTGRPQSSPPTTCLPTRTNCPTWPTAFASCWRRTASLRSRFLTWSISSARCCSTRSTTSTSVTTRFVPAAVLPAAPTGVDPDRSDPHQGRLPPGHGAEGRRATAGVGGDRGTDRVGVSPGTGPGRDLPGLRRTDQAGKGPGPRHAWQFEEEREEGGGLRRLANGYQPAPPV